MHSIGKKSVRNLVALAGAVASATFLVSQATAGTIYGIDDQNNLFTFDSLTPQTILSGSFISNLKSNEHLVGIDFRPADGVLYGIGSTGQVYTLNPANGVATAIGTGFGAISGNNSGMDFNPVADRIRFITDTDTSSRIFPNTGATPGGLAATDTPVHYNTTPAPNPNIVGAAYTYSDPAAGQTTLYGIDSNLDTLVRVGSVGGTADSPNNGNLTTIGALGLNTGNFVGFDITQNNIAFASLLPQNTSASHLYVINLSTGAATDQGVILGGLRVVDITTDPGVNFIVPEPGSLLGLSAAALALTTRRRQPKAR